jgi:hypothetical protein
VPDTLLSGLLSSTNFSSVVMLYRGCPAIRRHFGGRPSERNRRSVATLTFNILAAWCSVSKGSITSTQEHHEGINGRVSPSFLEQNGAKWSEMELSGR